MATEICCTSWHGTYKGAAIETALPIDDGAIPMICSSVNAWLDMATLVWTRGYKFPLDQLHGRLKCPNCGERRVQVFFEVPGEPRARSLKAAGCPSKIPRRRSRRD